MFFLCGFLCVSLFVCVLVWFGVVCVCCGVCVRSAVSVCCVCPMFVFCEWRVCVWFVCVWV